MGVQDLTRTYKLYRFTPLQIYTQNRYQQNL
jgi:hypothetical protein